MTDDMPSMNADKIILPEGLSKTTKALIDFSTIPTEVKKKFWDVFNNNLSLTFVRDKKDEKNLLRTMRLRIIDYLATIPVDEYDWRLEELLGQVQHEYMKSLMRAKGTNARVWNERSLIAMQISEGINTSNSQNNNNGPRHKFLGLF